jgi:hypothetical protein
MGDLSKEEEEWLRQSEKAARAVQHWLETYPDLLEACRATLAQLDYLRDLGGDEGVPRSLVDQVRAAVAKATAPPGTPG